MIQFCPGDLLNRYADDENADGRDAAAIQPMRRGVQATMPVRASLSRSRARRKDRARLKTRHKHLLFDGKHHRRQTKRFSRSLNKSPRGLCIPAVTALFLFAALCPHSTSFATRIRKNQNTLTAAEQNAFVNAVQALKQNGTYNQFVQTHQQAFIGQNNPAHRGPAFLPWHRKYIYNFETALLAADTTNTLQGLPYWEWSKDQNPNAVGSPWTANFLGGDGTGTGNAVTTGPFRQGQWTTLAGNPLTRNFGGSAGSLPTILDVFDVLNVSTYDVAPWNGTSDGNNSFRNRLEGWRGPGLHNQVHLWVGGDMLQTTSPDDPAFWLHHAEVDRLWRNWQSKHGIFNYAPVSGARQGHNLNDTMGLVGMTPNDVLQIPSTMLDYQYDRLFDRAWDSAIIDFSDPRITNPSMDFVGLTLANWERPLFLPDFELLDDGTFVQDIPVPVVDMAVNGFAFFGETAIGELMLSFPLESMLDGMRFDEIFPGFSPENALIDREAFMANRLVIGTVGVAFPEMGGGAIGADIYRFSLGSGSTAERVGTMTVRPIPEPSTTILVSAAWIMIASARSRRRYRTHGSTPIASASGLM